MAKEHPEAETFWSSWQAESQAQKLAWQEEFSRRVLAHEDGLRQRCGCEATDTQKCSCNDAAVPVRADDVVMGADVRAAPVTGRSRSRLSVVEEASILHSIKTDAGFRNEIRRTFRKTRWWGHRYTLFPSPAPPNLGCEDLCDRMKVVEAAYGIKDTTFNSSARMVNGSCSPSVEVNGVPIPSYTVYLGGDLVHNILPNVWTRAPLELTDQWQGTSGWEFDDPSCEWLYAWVSYDGCGSSFGQGGGANRMSFVVSAMMSYALYDIRSLEVVTTCTGLKLAVRIRYWVGLTNHFSFFPDMYEYPHSLDQLPSDAWYTFAQRDGPTGNRVDYWMSAVDKCVAKVDWRTDYTTRTYFSCPSHFVDDPVSHYYDAKGDAQPVCYSVHSTNHGQIQSLLGNSATGEVCFVVSLEEALSGDLITEGFVSLFGNRVTCTLYLNIQSGSKEGQDSVQRSQCVGPASLQSVDDFVATIDRLRQTPTGKWLFRSGDANQLKESSSKHEKSCCTTGMELVDQNP